MKKSLSIACLAVLILGVSCSGGGGPATPGGTPSPETTAQIKAASDSLAAGNITDAQTKYSAAITASSSNSESRFGRAFTNILLLTENKNVTDILAGLGQPPWQLSIALGPNGYLAQTAVNGYADNTKFPFFNLGECYRSYYSYAKPAAKVLRFKQCLLSRVVPGYSAEATAVSLFKLLGDIDLIIEDLKVAIADPAAKYTIPKGLAASDINIPVNHADMVQVLAGMYAAKAGIYFANSWTFNLDLGRLVDQYGNRIADKASIVEILNKQFVLRSENYIAYAKPALEQSILYSTQAIQEILAGSTGGILNLTDANKPIYQDLASALSAVKDSFGGEKPLAGIMPAVLVDLQSFFETPPSRSAIQSDPFVLEEGPYPGYAAQYGFTPHYDIIAVEAFWQQMLASGCNYKFHTEGLKAFSDITRTINRPYYQLFSTIMGHTFGKYKAGRGAD